MRIFLFSLLTIGLLSCGRTPLHFDVDAGFSADERLEIQCAADTWNHHLREPIELNGGPWRLVKRPLPPGQMAYTDREKRVIVVTHLKPHTIMHEFGHAEGLEHTSNGVMFWNESDFRAKDYLTVEDLAECRRADACP